MFKFVFVRTPRPRQFQHKPIYWNPEDDERKERDKRVKQRLGQTAQDEPFKTSIKRGSFRKKRWDSPDETADIQAERRRSNIRLLVIALILIALSVAMYWFI